MFGEDAETCDVTRPGYPPAVLDLMYAAQSWHWVDLEAGARVAVFAPAG